VGLDELEAAKRPMSDDPVFSELWVKTGDDSDMLNRVIARWRANARLHDERAPAPLRWRLNQKRRPQGPPFSVLG